MKYKWLEKREGHSKIIIFFNGWGMDENVVKHLEPDEYDILMFYDYNSLETEIEISLINKYSEKYLVAWSMGVMCATLFDISYTKKIAINGTLYPIDDNFGIPQKIYDLTLKGFSKTCVKKFIENMFNGNLPNIEIIRDLENQKSELIELKKYKSNDNFKYDKILISSNDKIIPTKNQVAFWKQLPNVNSGHAPFFLYKRWRELL